MHKTILLTVEMPFLAKWVSEHLRESGIIKLLMNNNLRIELPTHFTDEHQKLILKYLTRGRQSLSLSEWKRLLTGFDLLHQARVMTESDVQTFKQIYAVHVEQPYADLYINELLQLHDVTQGHTILRARIARIIVHHLQEVNLRQADVPISNLLLAYCLYFWESFAVGYAFEVEIYRDLTRSGVVFQAHDLRDQVARLSGYDLQILNQKGDVKTSLYFLFVRRSRELTHDFYITRFYEGNRQRTLVVILQPYAWKQINGGTVSVLLEEVTKQFPVPAMVTFEKKTVVIVEYNVWKAKVLKQQQGK
ncbi:MAG: hypothetical protein KJ063_24545 [Anaerolineae bacterium]|nr:hypothetical protein [Anaerolineae bacterium]